MLLDTQVIIWLATGAESELSAAATRCFHSADELYLSVVSYWEIALKRGLRKLRWEEGETASFERGLRENQIHELPIRHAHCDAIVTLPRHHRDPFDRMLIAQAQVEKFAILTSDKHFRAYEVKVVW